MDKQSELYSFYAMIDETTAQIQDGTLRVEFEMQKGMVMDHGWDKRFKSLILS